jgi:polyhydroxyalkanoate synthesis regulator phasin
MSGIDNILSQKQVFVAELITTAKEVKRAALRRRINILSTQIKKIEDDNENSDEQFLQEKLRSLLRQVRDLDKSN